MTSISASELLADAINPFAPMHAERTPIMNVYLRNIAP